MGRFLPFSESLNHFEFCGIRYNSFSVKHDVISGSESEKKNRLISLLQNHPEGIVLYYTGAPHAVLLTDYTDGTFWAADPAADGTTPCRKKLKDCWDVTVANATEYWFISSPKLTIDTHTHKYTSKVTKEATCSAEGEKTFTCSCGKSYTEKIAKKAHTYTNKIVYPTTEAGSYTLHTCSVCGYSYKDSETSKITVDSNGWYYADALDPSITSNKYEIQYQNIYNQTSATDPGNGWVKGSLAKSVYENDGAAYSTAKNVTTSDTLVMVSYHYYHWCGGSAPSGYSTTTIITTVSSVPELQIDKTDITLSNGEQYTIIANRSDVTYKSNNPDAAIVSAKGVITAVGVGQATISVIDSESNVVQIKVEVTAVVTPPETDYLLGDVNDDGEIGINDAQLALNAYVDIMAGNESTLSADQLKAADVNGDNEVSVEDAQFILIYYVQNTVADMPTTWKEILNK